MGLALEYFSWFAGDGGLGDALIRVNGHYIQYGSKAVDEEYVVHAHQIIGTARPKDRVICYLVAPAKKGGRRPIVAGGCPQVIRSRDHKGS